MIQNKRHQTLLMFVCCLLLVAAAPAVAAKTPAGVQARRAVARLPLYFIPNWGQLEFPASYYVQGGAGTALFSSEGVRFVFRAPQNSDGVRRPARAVKGIQLDRENSGPPEMLALEFVSSNHAEPVGEGSSDAVFSWFRGTREQWKTGLPMYTKIRYPELWPGIDLVYSGERGQLKYTFEVKPGAHPERIRLSYTGNTTWIARDESGGLSVSTAAGVIHEASPYVFQEINGAQVEVPTRYAVDEGNSPGQYGFSVGAYDRSRPLVIDPPSFLYAGFLGGLKIDRGLGIAVDVLGNAYFTGQVDTPVLNGFDFDAYVAKINPAGTALVYYSVFSGSFEDEAFDIVVDSAGNAYFTGASRSADYPVMLGPDLRHNGSWDAIVTKLAPNGADLVFSGFLGGVGIDSGEGIAIDGAGNVYIEGPTSSNQHSFPVKVGPDRSYNGNNDTFVAKIKAVPDSNSVRKNLIYCGYIGGNDDDTVGSGTSDGHIAVDSAGAAYVGGTTRSKEDSFPNGRGFGKIPGFDQTQNGGFDGYVVKILPDGSDFAYATYIGGAAEDQVLGMKVDSAGNAYFTGETQSDESTFPVTVGPDLTYNGGDSQGGDAFVAKLNATGTSLVYCGYIGGSDVDAGEGVALDASGALYVIGYTESSEGTFPVKGGPDLTFNGSGVNIGDGFICKVKPVPGGLDPFEYCGYIGGSGNDQAFWVAIDALGSAYVVGDTESTETTFPDGNGMTGIPGWDQTQAGNTDAFVVKISP